MVFRADAAFAKPELYEALEKREIRYAIRLPVVRRVIVMQARRRALASLLLFVGSLVAC